MTGLEALLEAPLKGTSKTYIYENDNDLEMQFRDKIPFVKSSLASMDWEYLSVYIVNFLQDEFIVKPISLIPRTDLYMASLEKDFYHPILFKIKDNHVEYCTANTCSMPLTSFLKTLDVRDRNWKQIKE